METEMTKREWRECNWIPPIGYKSNEVYNIFPTSFPNQRQHTNLVIWIGCTPASFRRLYINMPCYPSACQTTRYCCPASAQVPQQTLKTDIYSFLSRAYLKTLCNNGIFAEGDACWASHINKQVIMLLFKELFCFIAQRLDMNLCQCFPSCMLKGNCFP